MSLIANPMGIPIFFLLLAVVLLIAGNARRALTVVTGCGIYVLLGHMYDYVLWPVVQGSLGFDGALMMSLGAMTISLVMLQVYQQMKIDWLGVGAVMSFTSKAAATSERLLGLPSWKGKLAWLPGKLLRWMPRLLRSRPLAFLVLSTAGDSFLTTAFLRQGRFGPLEFRDLGIFAASTLVSCLVWVTANAGFLALFDLR